MTDVWHHVADARRDLARDLATLSSDQWEASSLCEGWRVRDVVGHLIANTEAGLGTVLAGTVATGFKPGRSTERQSLRLGAREPADLLDRFRGIIESRSRPPGARPIVMLTDTLCHAQDIRRPLRMSHRPSPLALALVADFIADSRGVNIVLGSRRRAAGLRLRATDAPWEHGTSGPEAAGPIEALVMALAGRRSATSDLRGPGARVLAARP